MNCTFTRVIKELLLKQWKLSELASNLLQLYSSCRYFSHASRRARLLELSYPWHSSLSPYRFWSYLYISIRASSNAQWDPSLWNNCQKKDELVKMVKIVVTNSSLRENLMRIYWISLQFLNFSHNISQKTIRNHLKCKDPRTSDQIVWVFLEWIVLIMFLHNVLGLHFIYGESSPPYAKLQDVSLE